jgi:hypothetical protein
MKRIITLHAVRQFLPLAAIIVLVGVTGCTEAEPSTSTIPEPTFEPAIEYIDVRVTEADNSESGVNVNILVRLAENADTSIVDIVYYYDVIPPVTPGEPAYSAPGTYVVRQQIGEANIWKNVPAGSHIFSAQLVTTDNNTPLNPPVIAQSIITVPPAESKTPEIRIMSVQLSWLGPEFLNEFTESPVPPLQVEVNTSVENIKLNDDKIGKSNVPGEGHIIYYLDVEPPTSPGQSATTNPGTYEATTNDFHIWENVSTTTHTFSIQLVNNDDTPLDPPVIAQITTTLPSEH